ncbi:hypothetical protein BU17DRAFT_68587 [Hysterangium stoloniferum]|nr:hypothetical protein BU17DRAFT_68587 [Hysterangium stoloniferum]
MRDAMVRTNDDKRRRNRAWVALRAEGKSDVDADEVLEAVPSEGVLRSMVTPTPGNGRTCAETGRDPHESGVGSDHSVIDKLDAGPLGMTDEGGVGPGADVHSTSALPAGLTAPLLTAINKGGPDLLLTLANASSSTSGKYRSVDYSKVPPIYNFAEIKHNKLELDPMSILNQVLHMTFKKVYIPLSMLTSKYLQWIYW